MKKLVAILFFVTLSISTFAQSSNQEAFEKLDSLFIKNKLDQVKPILADISWNN